MKHKIICGDAVEELKKLPENSVDACVTDPPFELNFMNRSWDRSGIAFNTDLWQELHRILKPGAHILVAGIARTHHRMWVALENAGFEIRDGIYHVFGSGFPKSTDISKQIDKCKAIRPDKSYDFGKYIKEKRIEHGISLTKMDELICNGTTNYSWFEGRPAGQRLPCLEEYIKMKEVLKIDDYWDVFIGEAERESIGRNNFGASSIYGSKIYNNRKEDKEIDITLSSTEEVIKWNGWGTALKPAVEIWCLARKSISERNIAANVLKWGCGGINVDGCRIGTNGGTKHSEGKKEVNNEIYGKGLYKEFGKGIVGLGRFPSNLCLECCCEEDELVEGKAYSTHRNWKRETKDESPGAFSLCVKKGYRKVGYKGDCIIHTNPNCVCRMLDEQGIERGVHSAGSKLDEGEWERPHTHVIMPSFSGKGMRFGDVGGPSRFFYQAKASQNERYFYCTICKQAYPMKERDNHIHNAPEETKYQYLEFHPTQKPLQLIQYLTRLITSPHGTVLDLFMGTGTTLVAAEQEGFNSIGVDSKLEYCRIAEKRLKNETIQLKINQERSTIEKIGF